VNIVDKLKEAGVWRCEACRSVGQVHCAYPDECGQFDVEKLEAKLNDHTEQSVGKV